MNIKVFATVGFGVSAFASALLILVAIANLYLGKWFVGLWALGCFCFIQYTLWRWHFFDAVKRAFAKNAPSETASK